MISIMNKAILLSVDFRIIKTFNVVKVHYFLIKRIFLNYLFCVKY